MDAVRGLVRGALAGTAATAAMSGWMVLSERLGIMRGQPPRKAVDRLAPAEDRRTLDALAVVSHAAYGAAAGAAFGAAPLPARVRPAAGIAYGVLLWAVGYEGWMPALGVLPAAHRDQRGRVLTMIAAHAIYGGVLGALSRRSSAG